RGVMEGVGCRVSRGARGIRLTVQRALVRSRPGPPTHCTAQRSLTCARQRQQTPSSTGGRCVQLACPICEEVAMAASNEESFRAMARMWAAGCGRMRASLGKYFADDCVWEQPGFPTTRSLDEALQLAATMDDYGL